jgi:hypothetical protein
MTTPAASAGPMRHAQVTTAGAGASTLGGPVPRALHQRIDRRHHPTHPAGHPSTSITPSPHIIHRHTTAAMKPPNATATIMSGRSQMCSSSHRRRREAPRCPPFMSCCIRATYTQTCSTHGLWPGAQVRATRRSATIPQFSAHSLVDKARLNISRSREKLLFQSSLHTIGM